MGKGWVVLGGFFWLNQILRNFQQKLHKDSRFLHLHVWPLRWHEGLKWLTLHTVNCTLYQLTKFKCSLTSWCQWSKNPTF